MAARRSKLGFDSVGEMFRHLHLRKTIGGEPVQKAVVLHMLLLVGWVLELKSRADDSDSHERSDAVTHS